MKTKRFRMSREVAGSLFLLVASGLSQSVASQKPTDFSLKIIEKEMNLTPNGVTSTDCIVVLPTGAFYLERRFQQLPASSAAHVSYQGQLSDVQRSELASLLNAEPLVTLPQWEFHPGTGDSVYGLHSFLTQIPRPDRVQEVGYYAWKATDPRDTLEFSPLKAGQERAASALQPLTQWFHHLEATQITPSKAVGTDCDIQDDSQ